MKYNAHNGGWTLEPSGPTTTCIFGTCPFMPTKCLIVRFLAVKCEKFSDIFSPLQAEAVTVRIVYDSSVNLSSIGQVIEDIKAIVSTVTKVSFTHTRRQANGVAHRLARTGLSVDQFCEWLGSPPSTIMDTG
ncbi:hypothetical protein DVH24_022321 [Malus domestica]|uniref:RNase H type-1 domain-containing protein n=1 Tax=Malus domestica TaxID=3750 RepID=A0A498KL22_MALDO|nr:hypothetical protein DVH24_022321 [Malus domestica]